MTRLRLRGALGAASILATVAAMAAPAFAVTATHEGHLLKGPSVALGQGTAQAWVALGSDGKPDALGVSMSESALRGIESAHALAVTLPFPAEAAASGFDHVLLNWNPHGHEPEAIWGSPHFDVHFYMTTPAEREAIAEADPRYMVKATLHPDARFVPPDYVPPPDPHPVPRMGVHWVDVTTPEFHGKAFTHTLIYGAWDGRFTFIEPMIAKTVFDERQSIVAPIKQPAAVAVPGRYPTRYRIDFDPNAAEHRIVLEGLVARE